ncbi:tRNA preQ1(34) S-adenosylmethionine ribosyltransferase-isomerase QueA [Amylibacter kogurei]|uniref:S-adenosylmethionine:tRNA ribosyltransferase-isomerase n=1 Tax=Paramylibacter kogurei TaxID=1889778 RepID=A0A2G5K5I9_9RHOB|nr:tRNA preQ1(34) S-adenosylmethionine ribosyltransferase-isomerase QueA [Amylibacter kogurei]PIB24788.1 tRNA preQ1(34) S-adenosylmethionine ribosyltransferase-isomerase QueA [Amylibacter kogurei]
MKLSDFDFELPEELIALRPAKPRSASRMLVAQSNDIKHQTFADLAQFLRPNDRLVLNNTKVIPARLNGQRRRISDNGETFAGLEITLLSMDTNGHWLTLAKPAKRANIGEQIIFADGFWAMVISKSEQGMVLEFNQSGNAFDQQLAANGFMPLPPYIASKRPADEQDMSDYQTVFAKTMGAVAAPTASLHFETDQLDKLREMGVNTSEVTLHVGAGTFLPVKVDDITDHKMHSEWGEVSATAAAEIAQTHASGGRVIPVGTTALRLIETAARGGEIKPWVGDTDIFITPGFEFHATDALITNFHLPKSTLLMLVSALMGMDRMKEIYQTAIAQNYRFFSYGDASLLVP